MINDIILEDDEEKIVPKKNAILSSQLYILNSIWYIRAVTID